VATEPEGHQNMPESRHNAERSLIGISGCLVEYIDRQWYLDPYPESPGLRNAI
jgi:hypothetical protein